MSGGKVLLITPPYHTGILESAGGWLNLGFAYMAGQLRKARFTPVYYDAMTKMDTLDEIKVRISQETPDYIATTAYTSSINAALEVLQAAKEIDPTIVTIIGGVHAHFMYEEVLRAEPGLGTVDFVIRGEGEETLVELIEILETSDTARPVQLERVSGLAYIAGGELIVTPPRPLIADLDTLSPAWDLLEWDLYTFYPMPGSTLAIINTSRGCLHSCTFCSQQKFWQQSYRQRSAEAVVEEMIMLKTKYGVDVFMFSDEYPTYDGERWEKILDMLIQRQLGVHILMETRVNDILRDRDILWKYKEAGVLHIYVGVEATTQETLDVFKKDVSCQNCQEAIQLINDNGMISECSFILGLPDETPVSIAQTLQLAKYYNPDLPHFLHLAVWPYADNYNELKEFVITRDYAKYNFINPVIKPVAMTEDEIKKALIDCYQDFYMDKVKEYLELKDDFKRNYLLKSLKLMMEKSFLREYIAGSGPIPESIRELIQEAG